MKIALYIAFQNKSSIDCSKEIIDLVSDNNQLVVDSKLKNEIDKNKSSNLIFFDSNESISFDLIINATSSSLGAENVVLPNNLNGQFWYDMMYGKQTTFLSMAEKSKAKFCDGLGMLVEQASAAFYIWHKEKPDTKPLYKIL